jgi:hypothetical protein
MRSLAIIRTTALIFSLTFLSGCAGSVWDMDKKANQAWNQMIGMNKDQVLACAGVPARQQKTDAQEFWSYGYPGAGCTANIAFTGSRVSDVRYLNPGGARMTPLSDCGRLVAACVR